MTATAESTTIMELVEKLTDKAIENEIRKLDRMIKARGEEIIEIQEEVLVFVRRRTVLIEQKIGRLKAQLPEEQQ